MTEKAPRNPVTPEVARYIKDTSGGIIPLERILTGLVATSGIVDPGELAVLLPDVQPNSFGGRPVALFHALSSGYPMA